LVAISVGIESSIAIEPVAVGDLPAEWRAHPAPPELTVIGDRWLQRAARAVLSVSSVVIPHERNFVINDFSNVKVGESEPFSFDARMWKRRL
jgi:hypothetical protein